MREQQQHEQLRSTLHGVLAAREFDCDVRRIGVRIRLQFGLPHLRRGVLDQHERQLVWIVLLAMLCAGECHRDVRRNHVRFCLRRRLPRMRSFVRGQHRSHSVRGDVHGLLRAVQRRRDLYDDGWADVPVRHFVQRGLSQLQRGVREQLEHRDLRHVVRLVQPTGECGLDLRRHVVRLHVQRSVQRLRRRVLCAVYRQVELRLVRERVLGAERNAELHRRDVRRRVVQRRLPRVWGVVRPEHEREQLRAVFMHAVHDSAQHDRHVRRPQLWVYVRDRLREPRRERGERLRVSRDDDQ